MRHINIEIVLFMEHLAHKTISWTWNNTGGTRPSNSRIKNVCTILYYYYLMNLIVNFKATEKG